MPTCTPLPREDNLAVLPAARVSLTWLLRIRCGTGALNYFYVCMVYPSLPLSSPSFRLFSRWWKLRWREQSRIRVAGGTAMGLDRECVLGTCVTGSSVCVFRQGVGSF